MNNIKLKKKNIDTVKIEEEIKLLSEMQEKIKSLLANRLIYYIGKTHPNLDNLNKEEIIDTFLYYFSFLSCYSLEGLDIDKLRKEFKYTINTVEKNKNIKLSNDKIWWVLVLDYIRFLGDRHELFLIIDTTSSLINKVDSLDEKELATYVNILNNSFYNEVGEGLRIRPLLVENIESETLQENIYFMKWIKSKSKVLEKFKENFNLKDFNNKLLKKELDLLSKLNIKYDSWDVIFEIFISHIVAIVSPNENEDEIEFYNKLEVEDIEIAITLTLSKLTRNSKVNKQSIELLSKELSQVMFIQN